MHKINNNINNNTNNKMKKQNGIKQKKYKNKKMKMNSHKYYNKILSNMIILTIPFQIKSAIIPFYKKNYKI